jgi:hypothetical protein
MVTAMMLLHAMLEFSFTDEHRTNFSNFGSLLGFAVTDHDRKYVCCFNYHPNT